MVDLTVSIVNTDNCDLLRDCLRSLFEGTRRISMEVFVVDNASTDGSAEMVRREFSQVRLIRNVRRLRFCANHNQVLRRSQGRYVVILNEDTVVPVGTFDALVAFMDAHPEAGAAGVTVRYPDGSLQFSYADMPDLRSTFVLSFGLNLVLPLRRYPCVPLSDLRDGEPQEAGWVSGACMLVRREAMEQVGLLDEAFLIYSEETDWCYRIRQAGWKVYFLPSLHIVHYQGRSTSQLKPRRRFRIQRSWMLFFRKHYGRLHTLALRAILLMSGLIRLVFWGGCYLVGWRRDRGRMELRYNARTVLIGVWRDDLFDAELMEVR